MKQVPELTGPAMAASRPRPAGTVALAMPAGRCRHRSLGAWPATAVPTMAYFAKGRGIGHQAISATGSCRPKDPST